MLEKLVSQRMSKKLDKNQRIIIDEAISANNHCGAMYGIAAYRLGLHDGIRLMSEVKEIRNQK